MERLRQILQRQLAEKLYSNGEGTEADKAKAHMWLEKAAAQGNEKAKAFLERLAAREKEEAEAQARREQADREKQEQYEKGMELYRAGNYEEAFPLLDKICSSFGRYKHQYPDAWVAKGYMLENGCGTEANLEKAHHCYRIAAQNGERDGMAGVVRLTAKLDDLSSEYCQAALDYAKELNDGKLNALIPTLEQKLARAQTREKFAEFDLNVSNVQAIFNRCLATKDTPNSDVQLSILFKKIMGYDEDSEPMAFCKSTIKKNKKNILYLLGQLDSVHKGSRNITAKESIFRYDGKQWATSNAVIGELYHLAEAADVINPFVKKYNRSATTPSVKPTLSPKGPNFPAWWEEHKSEWEIED